MHSPALDAPRLPSTTPAPAPALALDSCACKLRHPSCLWSTRHLPALYNICVPWPAYDTGSIGGISLPRAGLLRCDATSTVDPFKAQSTHRVPHRAQGKARKQWRHTWTALQQEAKQALRAGEACMYQVTGRTEADALSSLVTRTKKQQQQFQGGKANLSICVETSFPATGGAVLLLDPCKEIRFRGTVDSASSHLSRPLTRNLDRASQCQTYQAILATS